MKKEGGYVIFLIVILFLFISLSFVFAQEENETTNTLQENQTVNIQPQENQTIKCYSSKDCPINLPYSSLYWCDNSSACQKLAQCSNPGTPQSECSVVDECVNCINIGYLGCKDGQCQKINCYKNEDCGVSTSKKYCNGLQACTQESITYCNNPGIIDSYCTNKFGNNCAPCTYGCENGVCKEASQLTPTTPTTCTDSDGSDYYTQGKACSGTNCEVDSCAGNTVVEYGCKDNRVGVIFTYGCEKCENGACVIETTTTPGCVQKGNACCKGENMCAGITCQQGYTFLFKGCDSNCTAIGTCQSTETISEQVKCVFKDSKTLQKCYLSEYNDKFYCSGNETCVMDVKGAKGEKMTWKSTCGGYVYTVLDGNNEYAEFDCSEKTDSCQSSQCSDGSLSKCYVDSNGYCVCSTCSEIIMRPVCGNGICESGEWQVCETTAETCQAGEKCEVSLAKCSYGCEQDCKGIEGIEAKLNEQFKLQVGQAVKIIDYKGIKLSFRDLLTPSCEPSVTNVEEVKQKLAGYAIEATPTTTTPVEIIKCPGVGPMAQLEVVNPEEMGSNILTLKAGEAKNIYDISISFLEYDFASRTGVFVINSKPIICPENCKCDSEGYTLECKTEEKCEVGKMLCPDNKCKEKCEITNLTSEECKSGCIYGDKCLPIGVRVKGAYCSIDTILTSQFGANENCENNFECKSNLCIDSKCVSEGAWKKFINWFSRLFGGKETEIIDCGGDTECWENAFKICQPAKISQGGDNQRSELGGMVIEIIGLEGEKCVVKWTATIEGSEESMTCKFENYTLGKDMVSGSMEQYCTGALTYRLASFSKMATAPVSNHSTVATGTA